MRTIDKAALGMSIAGTALLLTIAAMIQNGRSFGIVGWAFPVSLGLLFGGIVLYCAAGDEVKEA